MTLDGLELCNKFEFLGIFGRQKQLSEQESL